MDAVEAKVVPCDVWVLMHVAHYVLYVVADSVVCALAESPVQLADAKTRQALEDKRKKATTLSLGPAYKVALSEGFVSRS